MTKKSKETAIWIVVIILIVGIFFYSLQFKDAAGGAFSVVSSDAGGVASKGVKPLSLLPGQLRPLSSYGSCKTVGDTEYCCDDPNYPKLCVVEGEEGVCGATNAWCDNYNNGGGHCKPSDPGWCCNDKNYVVCGETDTCGPSQDWCSNFLDTNGKSCDPSNGYCCNDAGYIYQYSTNYCCPPTAPYLSSDSKGCYTSPQPNGPSNWYTQNNECALGDKSCQGSNYLACEGSSYDKFLYVFVDKGQTAGQCGIECTQGQEKCDGNKLQTCGFDGRYGIGSIVQDKCGIECTTNQQCGSTQKCDNYICVESDKSVYYRLQDNKCSQIELYPAEVTENDYLTLEGCQSKITKDPTMPYVIIFVLIAGIVALLVWIIKKTKGRKR